MHIIPSPRWNTFKPHPKCSPTWSTYRYPQNIWRYHKTLRQMSKDKNWYYSLKIIFRPRQCSLQLMSPPWYHVHRLRPRPPRRRWVKKIQRGLILAESLHSNNMERLHGTMVPNLHRSSKQGYHRSRLHILWSISFISKNISNRSISLWCRVAQILERQ